MYKWLSRDIQYISMYLVVINMHKWNIILIHSSTAERCWTNNRSEEQDHTGHYGIQIKKHQISQRNEPKIQYYSKLYTAKKQSTFIFVGWTC